ncbi:MAG TPA: GIY-YIG nuclease family protein [Candidatus Paceibacterota bacterium]|nr:GIY-YIG nuclease family protein [Candidatus Paceibacterota bacterium]
MRTDTQQSVYVLVDDERGDIKIGRSVNPCVRSGFVANRIDPARSKLIRCHRLSAKHVERVLHETFADYRQPRRYGDGKTEWFAATAYIKVLRFIDQNYEYLGGVIEPLPILLPARKRRAADWRQQAAIGCHQTNWDAYTALRRWSTKVHTAPSVAGCTWQDRWTEHSTVTVWLYSSTLSAACSWHDLTVDLVSAQYAASDGGGCLVGTTRFCTDCTFSTITLVIGFIRSHTGPFQAEIIGLLEDLPPAEEGQHYHVGDCVQCQRRRTHRQTIFSVTD